jgi:hypothetical protein
MDDGRGGADWLDPDRDVMALLPELNGRGARTALDLGCGVGRHALFLAELSWRSPARASLLWEPASRAPIISAALVGSGNAARD